MRKLILSTIVSMALAGSLFGATTTKDKTDYREGNTVNRCIQVAEYVNDGWVEFTKRQLRASSVFDLNTFTPYKMDFGGIKFKYNETVEIDDKTGNADIYRGTLGNGKGIKASSLVNNRSILFVEIEGQHLKKMICVNPKD